MLVNNSKILIRVSFTTPNSEGAFYTVHLYVCICLCATIREPYPLKLDDWTVLQFKQLPGSVYLKQWITLQVLQQLLVTIVKTKLERVPKYIPNKR